MLYPLFAVFGQTTQHTDGIKLQGPILLTVQEETKLFNTSSLTNHIRASLFSCQHDQIVSRLNKS